jgi:uncharacterized protein YbcI
VEVNSQLPRIVVPTPLLGNDLPTVAKNTLINHRSCLLLIASWAGSRYSLSIQQNFTRNQKISESTKTQGEMEASICQCISRFEHEFMGRGPKDIHAHLIDDLVIVRLRGVLTSAEQHLVKTLPVDKGRDLLKQVRSQLIEIARPKLEEIIRDITGVRPVSLHHDISTVTGEEIVIFTLADSPSCRELKRK